MSVAVSVNTTRPREIMLSGGRAVTTVDDGDYPALAVHRWSLGGSAKFPYARRRRLVAEGGTANAPKIAMHRTIVGVSDPSVFVDHINGNGLDNRRANLRLADHGLNAQNQHSARGSSSRFRGVSWNQAMARWIARVCLNGQSHYLGQFTDELDAARAVDAFRIKHMPYAQPDPALVAAAPEDSRSIGNALASTVPIAGPGDMPGGGQ